MTIPAAPLPGLGSLLRSATAPASRGELWRRSNGKEDVALIYWRGSLALAAGVEAVRKSAGTDQVTVWVPGYFCNEALDPVRQLRGALQFYPVQEDLTPDWPTLMEKAGGVSGAQVFVLVHYFGFPNAASQAKAFCDEHQMVLLEDAAHVLRLNQGMGYGDMLVFSPRKLLPVPSGGILVTSQKWATNLTDIPVEPHGSRDTVRWLGRRLAQKAFVPLHVPWHLARNGQTAESPLDYANGNGHQTWEEPSPFDLRLLTVMEQDQDDVAERRRSHYQQLLVATEDLDSARPLFDSLPDGVCPYAFPLLLEGDSAGVASALQAKGVPASTWPDLPPEVLRSREEHKTSIQTYEKLLLLPVHQSLNHRQVNVMCHRLKLALSGKDNSR